MDENRMKEIIDQQLDIYINNIARKLEKSHDRWFDSYGFPIFGETSKEYHEQVYFQSFLESYTRTMINSIIKEMLNEVIADEIVWPEFEYPGIYNGYTNIEFEKEFGFEFINRDTRIGYRYTGFYDDEIDYLLIKGNIDSIVQVVWENEDNRKTGKRSCVCFYQREC